VRLRHCAAAAHDMTQTGERLERVPDALQYLT
jgi:hypothetical protein